MIPGLYAGETFFEGRRKEVARSTFKRGTENSGKGGFESSRIEV